LALLKTLQLVAYQQSLCQVNDEIVNTRFIKIKYSANSAECKIDVSEFLRTKFMQTDSQFVLTSVARQA